MAKKLKKKNLYAVINQPLPGTIYPISDNQFTIALTTGSNSADLEIDDYFWPFGWITGSDSNYTASADDNPQHFEMDIGYIPDFNEGWNKYFSWGQDGSSSGFSFGVYLDTGSGSSFRAQGHARRCKFSSAGQPVPAALSLQLDSSAKGGTSAARQLYQPTQLIHSQDPSLACCWFSRPLQLGADKGSPAFWVLEKTAADTWTLTLRRVTGDAATYVLKSRNKKSDVFPIQLKLTGRPGNDLKNWPKTVTITPAQ